MTRVFVYGTLKKGYINNKILKNSRFLGYGRTEQFSLFCNGCLPMAVNVPNNTGIHGEIYEVDVETLKNIKYIEEFYYFDNTEIIQKDKMLTCLIFFKKDYEGFHIVSGYYEDSRDHVDMLESNKDVSW